MQNQTYLCLLCCLMLCTTLQALPKSAFSAPTPEAKNTERIAQKKAKPSLRERIAHKLIQKKWRKAANQTEAYGPSSADVALGLGLGAVGLNLIMAISSSVVAILAILSIFCGIGAVVFGIIALSKINKLENKKRKGRGKAIIGMLLGFVVAALWILLILTVGG